MRRWTLRILLLLFLGAVTTVAVAWGIALTTHPFRSGRSTLREVIAERGARVLYVDRRDVVGGTFIGLDYFIYRDRFDIAASHETEYTIDDLAAEVRDRIEGAKLVHGFVLFGWPSRSLMMEEWVDDGGSTTGSAARWETPLPPFESSVSHEPRFVPLRPIFPGFLINTLVYAAIWCGIFVGFASARRAIRRKRGRCPMCGYELRGGLDDGCPECGWGRNAHE